MQFSYLAIVALTASQFTAAAAIPRRDLGNSEVVVPRASVENEVKPRQALPPMRITRSIEIRDEKKASEARLDVRFAANQDNSAMRHATGDEETSHLAARNAAYFDALHQRALYAMRLKESIL